MLGFYISKELLDQLINYQLLRKTLYYVVSIGFTVVSNFMCHSYSNSSEIIKLKIFLMATVLPFQVKYI
jgi:hypothetical protein